MVHAVACPADGFQTPAEARQAKMAAKGAVEETAERTVVDNTTLNHRLLGASTPLLGHKPANTILSPSKVQSKRQRARSRASLKENETIDGVDSDKPPETKRSGKQRRVA